jgi:site-specific DNA recombinase
LIVCRLNDDDARDLLVVDRRPDLDELRARRLTLTARLDDLALAFAEGEVSAAQLRAGTERLRARLAEIDAEMADAGRVNALGPLVDGDAEQVWDGFDIDRQRAVVDMLFARITVASPGPGRRFPRGADGYDLERVAATVTVVWAGESVAV